MKHTRKLLALLVALLLVLSAVPVASADEEYVTEAWLSKTYNAKVGHEVKRGGHGYKVLLDGLGILLGRAVDSAGVLKGVEHPSLDLARVGERLQRGEGLGDNDHERGLGVQAF